MQLTVPQLSTLVLERALPLFRSGDPLVAIETGHLLHVTLDVMVAVVTPSVWVDQSLAAREFVSYGFTPVLILLKHLKNSP